MQNQWRKGNVGCAQVKVMMQLDSLVISQVDYKNIYTLGLKGKVIVVFMTAGYFLKIKTCAFLWPNCDDFLI